ncbi:MAG: Eco57I restriction-modification methylase domain-containing protein [Candidatus Nanohaloarchaea archaeon]
MSDKGITDLPDVVSNNLFSNHFLKRRLQEIDEWQENEEEIEEAFRRLKQEYRKKEMWLSTDPNEQQTQEQWIDVILEEILGHHSTGEVSRKVGNNETLNPDYGFLEDFSQREQAGSSDDNDYIDYAYAIGDAKRWKAPLDRSTDDRKNPAYQIYDYVERLRTDWGILTNGKKWRIYSYEDCAIDTFYEVDLEAILQKEGEQALQEFKYFYLFFRQKAFLPSGKGFLSKVLEGSVTYSETLEENLEEKVYSALEVAVKGFFETNDIEKTEDNIDQVHHASLIFLYRLLFILNAESRGLLPVDDGTYRQAFGLVELKKMLIEDSEDNHLFEPTVVAWDKRIVDLFDAIDDGYEDKVPAYNGGLFDSEESPAHKFLEENKLQGNYLKEILELLATTKDDENQKALVDYRDLNIRHLGSIYEGLLEHNFDSAEERLILKNGEWKNYGKSGKGWNEIDDERKVEKGELYLTNESGERKATGSYYTPEYIVEYIVENTVGPKVEEKIEEAQDNGENTLAKILEINICDPAMGSGHFLTEATEFVAEKIIQNVDLQEQDIEEENELTWTKRHVVQNCIYGVDINPLATELAKLSLWIETMAEGKPLSFLDHHLKTGNSLIGSNFEEIFQHPNSDEQKKLERDYSWGDPREIRKQFMKEYRKIEEMPETTVKEIHEKEQAYKDFIQENEYYRQFKKLANIHTYQYFNENVNQSKYSNLVNGIKTPVFDDYTEDDWFEEAQQDAESRNYFHWQLEFPKVFFGDTEGFDAVVGNPPYVTFQEIPDGIRDSYRKRFETFKMKGDIYVLFMELSHQISGEKGKEGFIIQNKFTKAKYGEGLRKLVAEKERIEEIINFHDSPVFEVLAYPMILLRTKSQDKKEFTWRDIREDSPSEIRNKLFSDQKGWKVDQRDLGSDNWSVFSSDSTINSETVALGEFANQIGQGLIPGNTEVFLVDKKEIKENNLEEKFVKPVLRGGDVEKYWSEKKGNLSHIIYPYKSEDGEVKLAQEDEIPNIISYLETFEEELKERKNYGEKMIDQGYEWYELRYNSPGMLNSKIMFPDISPESRFALDESGEKGCLDTVYFIVRNSDFTEYSDKVLLSLLNSSFSDYVFSQISPKVRGGYLRYKSQYVEKFPVPKLNSGKLESLNLAEKVDKIKSRKSNLKSINLKIQDYLGNYSDGHKIGDLYSPAEGLSDIVLTETSTDRENLRIGGIEFEDHKDNLILKASVRYKPENESEHETDRWGYTESEMVPAMKFDVDEKMQALIREFVPVAVNEAGGFAGFRESATKTKSVIDRLEELTLPKLEDVEDGLEKFIENREKAEGLRQEIKETNHTIDATVFDLYNLAKEEVETVLDSLGTEEEEKKRILEKFEKLD